MAFIQSVSFRRLLKKQFDEWVKPRVDSHREPERRGTPKGHEIGFSKKKYYAAQLQALYGIIIYTIPELAQHSGISNGLYRVWRTDRRFKKAGEDARKEFIEFLANEALNEMENEKRHFIVLDWLTGYPEGPDSYYRNMNKFFEKISAGAENVDLNDLLKGALIITRRLAQINSARLTLEDKKIEKDEFKQLRVKDWENILARALDCMEKKSAKNDLKKCRKIIEEMALLDWQTF